jgi:hypothetical protein
MPAVSTRLEISCPTNSHKKYEPQQLFWWAPSELVRDSRFSEVLDNGYRDRVATLTSDEFLSLNHFQIEQAQPEILETFSTEITELEEIVALGCSRCDFRVTLFEWESGLDNL